MKNKKFITILFLIPLLFSIISCSEDNATDPPTASITPLAKFSDIKAKVFVNCTGAQCHSSAGNQANLILESNVAFNNLVNVQSTLFLSLKE